MSGMLAVVDAADVRRADQESTLDAATINAARAIVEDVRVGGEPSLRGHAERFGEVRPGDPVWHDRGALLAAVQRIPARDADMLRRTAARVTGFALAQRAAVQECRVAVPGGEAGHTLEPIERVGCYVPGGRYPLPSTAIMTVATARAAGCAGVIAASPRPTDHTLAAAAIAGAHGLLAIGGAHAVAALAFGTPWAGPVDLICGPGNRWVTAAKHVVSTTVGIDMLAGPSELVVLADDTGDAGVIAADLLAQAEHDDLARPILVTTAPALADAVNREVARRVDLLGSRETARRACQNGFIAVAGSMGDAVAAVDRLAPEHLEIHTRDAWDVSRRIRHAGGVFVGALSAEVFGDFGFGPNHTLPTGGAARATAGLSVLTFLRARTWLRLDTRDDAAIRDAVHLAEIEGLPGHRASAAARLASE